MWMNKFIFEDEFHMPVDHTRVFIDLVRAINRDNHLHITGGSKHFDTICIGLKRPWGDWVKFICDGAYKESLDLAGCGV
jgi:hypothetical protein